MADENGNRAEGDVDKLVYRKFFSKTEKGVFVDVGAARPDFISVSAHFRTLGWQIIAVEPNEEFCKLYREKGYEVLPFACGDHDEDGVEFSIVNSHGSEYEEGNVSFESFSSLKIKDSYANLKEDLDIKKVTVNLRRLDTLLREYAPDVETIDILSIDVEGWELEVMDGLTVSKYQPRVMVIENLFNERKYLEYMEKLDYVLWRRIYPNDVYVRRSMLSWLDAVLRGVYNDTLLRRKK